MCKPAKCSATELLSQPPVTVSFVSLRQGATKLPIEFTRKPSLDLSLH